MQMSTGGRDKNFGIVCKIKAYMSSNRIGFKLTTAGKIKELLEPMASRDDKRKIETKKRSWK